MQNKTTENHHSSMLQDYFKRFCCIQKIANPIIQEFPYICFFMFLMGLVPTLQTIHGRWVAIDSPGAYHSFYNLFGRLSIWFLSAYIGAIIMTLYKARWIKILCYTIVVIMSAIQHFLIQNFSLRISPSFLVLLAETTNRESKEFIDQYIFSEALLPTLKMLFFYIFLICASEWLWNIVKRRIVLLNATRWGITCLVIPILFFGVSYAPIYWKIYKASSPDNIRWMEAPDDPFSSLYASFVTTRIMGENMKQAVESTKQMEVPQLMEIMQQDSLNVVVVIGESYIKKHSQLYGYNLHTTPFLKKEQKNGRLFVFNNVVSPSNSTTVVMRNVLCCNNSSEHEEWYKYPFFPAVFKQSGYNVVLWDNQLECDPNATYSFTLNSFLYNPEMREMAYTVTNKYSYPLDGDLIRSYKDSIMSHGTSRLNLIIFHLMGQHHMATDRYPHKTFQHFNADSIRRDAPFLDKTKKAYIAAYDNATLYNDYVLNEIINMFRDSETVLVYLSDHGEEVYDYRDQCSRDHGEMTPNKLKYQYEIPFMIWCSDSYKVKHPEFITCIHNAINRPFMSDNLCHLLFSIAGIKTIYYKSQYDLISPSYRCNKRIINEQYDYDKIRN